LFFREDGSSSLLVDFRISSVRIIGATAFAGNKIVSVTIPDNVFIGLLPFGSIGPTCITIGVNVTLGGNNIAGLDDANFNQAYDNLGRQAGTFTRPNVDSSVWTRR